MDGSEYCHIHKSSCAVSRKRSFWKRSSKGKQEVSQVFLQPPSPSRRELSPPKSPGNPLKRSPSPKGSRPRGRLPSEGKQEESPIRSSNDLFVLERLLETVESPEDIWNLCNINRKFRDFCVNTERAADIFKRRLLKERGVDLGEKMIADVRQEYGYLAGVSNWLQIYRVMSLRRFVQISSGSKYSVGLLGSGIVMGWGKNGRWKTNLPSPPKGKKFVQISVGGYHSLALLDDGTVVGWGDDEFDQSNPPPPPRGKRFIQISAGENYSLGLLSDGTISSWGYGGEYTSEYSDPDEYSGDDDYDLTDIPDPPEGKRFVQVSAGDKHSLGLVSDGTVLGWGYDNHGEDAPPPPPRGRRFIQISAGENHSLGLLDNGTIVGWGRDGYGQATPPPPPKGKRFVQVSAGQERSLGLLSDGTVLGWGKDDTNPSQFGDKKIIQISSGGTSLGLQDDGSVVMQDFKGNEKLIDPLD